jgi:Zn-dependent peptidase ImmA (M78 family)
MGANGAMLRLARQRKGFHQTQAAERLGIEQPILSRMENGLTEIRGDVILKASQVYEVPASFFSQAQPVYGPPVSVHPMYRRKADVTGRELDSVVAELNVRVMHLRKLLDAAEVANSAEIPKLDVNDYEDPEEIAAVVRAHWRVPRGPIADLTLLAERAGIFVVHSPLSGTSISGVTFAVPGLAPLVILNSEQTADRQRWSLAHEIGHLVMHRLPSASMEEEANIFASALLMPADDIRPAFLGRRVDLRVLAALKPEWRVSMQALLMRARSIGAISDNQAQYLWKQISARKYRLREPPELDFPPEKPTVVESIIKLHLETLGYSLADLAAILHEFESSVASMYSVEKTSEKQRPKIAILK